MNLHAKIWAERVLLIFVLVMIVLVYFYVTTPALREVIRPHHCLFYQATGLLCPACGGTRAIGHLFDGNLPLALKSNALAVFSLPAIACGVLAAFRLVFDPSYGPSDIRISPYWLWSLPVLIIIFWIVRNLTYFSFLSPI